MSKEDPIELNRWEQAYVLLFLLATVIGGILQLMGIT